MRAADLIRQKRDGGSLDRDAIDAFVTGVTSGTLPDYQASALLMAIFLRGLSGSRTRAAALHLRFLPAANYNGAAPSLTAHLVDNSQTFTSGAIVNLSG